jgi:uncharacterized protein
MKPRPGTACITGASSGIGAAFARRLARDGYDLILHGRREALLQSLADQLARNHGVRTEVLRADLAAADGVRIVEDRIAHESHLSLLVNNAGYSTIKHFSAEPIDGQEALIRVHVVAPTRLTHAAIPAMRARGEGAIINVSSVAGFLIGPGSATYCATKAYLINFTETLHLELEGTGIRMQALCPGFTLTDFHKKLGYDVSSGAFKNFMSADAVVEQSIKDLRRGKVVSVPGLQYKIAAVAPRFIPRRVFYRIVELFSASKRAKGGLPLGNTQE